MQFAWVWSFQPSLERRARLTSFIFLNPKPPRAFGRHKESQDLRDRLWDLFGGKPPQKSLNNLSNLLQKLMGRRKELIAKEGMAATTDLIRTNLPAWERDLALQPSTFNFILSKIPWKGVYH
jgi:hypothetical protein